MPRLTIVLFLLALSMPSASAAEGCPFLSDAEVEEVTGRELLLDLTSMALPDRSGTICDSSTVRVILLPGNDSAARWDGMMKGGGRPSSVGERPTATPAPSSADAKRTSPQA